ncbi:MAG: hypothetical protein JSU86_10930 [Phycisphaerales bacterium]|nr:MAG: hypothetical protein JSU86_10930 [Phycisphaerales bacterium]
MTISNYLKPIMLGLLVALCSGVECTTQQSRDNVIVQHTEDHEEYTVPDIRSIPLTEAEQRALQAAERKILAAWEKVQSGSATLVFEAKRPAGPGDVRDFADLRLGVQFTGQLDFLKKDGRLHTRERTTRMADPSHGLDSDATLIELTETRISDGESHYIVQEFDGQTNVIRIRAPQFVYAGKDTLDQMRGASDLIWLAADEEIDGRQAYVISTTGPSRTEFAGMFFQTCFDKKTGIMVRNTWYHPNYGFFQVLSLKDLKVDMEFPKGHFTYVPPKGVEVIDSTEDRKRAAPGFVPR